MLCHLINFMKQKQTWKSNYSTVRLYFLVWSSVNFPSVCLCIIGCLIWPVGRFLVQSRSSFLPLYVNLFSYLVSKCWLNYCGIMLFVKGMCSTKVPHTVADPDLKIRRGPGHPDPEIRGGGRSPKRFFSALQASVWSKNKGGAPRAPPLDLPLP